MMPKVSRSWNASLLPLVFAMTLSSYFGCSSEGAVTTTKFVSAHSVALQGRVSSGVVKIPKTVSGERLIREHIFVQLSYTVGQLNGYGSVAELGDSRFTIVNIDRSPSSTNIVTYNADFLVSWPEEKSHPASLELVLPVRVDQKGVTRFYKKFGRKHPECISESGRRAPRKVDPRSHFYFHRPQNCQLLSTRQAGEESLVSRMKLRLSKRRRPFARKKYPEYHKVWEDGRLTVTLVFGKNERNGSDSDSGVFVYRRTHESLVQTYGNPTRTTLPSGRKLGVKYPRVTSVFETKSGPLEVHFFLTPSLVDEGSEFASAYGRASSKSDFVAYAGHSGLGGNINAVARFVDFQRGQYQIFYFDGCASLAYIDPALVRASQSANGGSSRYIDIVTNAMDTPFYHAPSNVTSIIEALVRKKRTYESILNRLPRSSRAAVTGEQDNRWPRGF